MTFRPKRSKKSAGEAGCKLRASQTAPTKRQQKQRLSVSTSTTRDLYEEPDPTIKEGSRGLTLCMLGPRSCKRLNLAQEFLIQDSSWSSSNFPHSKSIAITDEELEERRNGERRTEVARMEGERRHTY